MTMGIECDSERHVRSVFLETAYKNAKKSDSGGAGVFTVDFCAKKKKIRNKKISKTRVLFKVRITYKDELLGTRPFCRPFGPPFVRGGENIAPVDAAGPC